MEKVLVTGATGFIGLHCVHQLLEKGYSVRGTLRSQSRAQEVRDGLSSTGVDIANLELVEADLLNDDGWEDAVTGMDYILHVASPFIIGMPKHEDDLIRPAVEGTERVLSAAIAKKVKKVVLTSSCAAIVDTFDGKQNFTEDDWSNPHHPKIAAYNKSKTLAERRAWEMIEAQTGTKQTELVVINPAGVVGPTITDDLGTSNVFIKKIICGEVPGAVRMHLGFVDVRDVASAHIAAMTSTKANGQRFIISEREFWFSDICQNLREAGYNKAPTRVMPNWLVRMIGLVDGEIKQIASLLGEERYTPADKARDILKWKPRDVTGSIIETAHQLKERGLV